MIATILLTLGLAYLIRYYIKSRRGPGDMPGPTLRFPLIGSAFHLFKGQLIGYRKLKKEYGGLYSMITGPGTVPLVYAADLAVCQDMFSQDVFNGRIDLRQINSGLAPWLKGGTGMHGIISNAGDEWKEQRRFALRHLRDFGFGKASMSELIQEEWDDIAEILKEKHSKGEEVETQLLFNLSALNIIWRIVAGKRFDMNDTNQKQRLVDLSKMFGSFGVANFGMLLSIVFLPNWLYQYSPLMRPIKKVYDDMFKMFEEEYEEHEKSYDPNSMRDFMDVFMRERKRATSEEDTNSSFYGEVGRHNFNNTMFDLFLAGSESTSTTATFFILYLLHNPSVQSKLQDEVDRVVGRERPPALEDRESMPLILSFITEVHRHATVAPIAVHHAAMHTAEFRGYTIKENTPIVLDLSTIMNDPENFDNPDTFEAERFINKENGQYVPHPAMCQYGIGKRECPGKSLAKNEQFMFLTNMLQTFTVEPSATEALPSVYDASISVTRVPKAFKARFIPRTD